MASIKLSILLDMITITTLLLSTSTSSTISNVIQRGFTTNPTPTSSNKFQSILTDPTSRFSLVFLRLENNHLDLAIIHLPSAFPLWRASPNHLASWSTSTTLTFNGSLLLSDPKTGVFWSTRNTMAGDQLVLLNSSNLQITKSEKLDSVLWQSFDFPSDTIIQNQNFTSKSSLISINQKYSMSLGFNFMALYLENLGGSKPMYWKRTALQAKAQIIEGDGPIYARIDPTGYLGVYQTEEAPADVMSFDTFNGGGKIDLRRLTVENDGNWKAYYWSGSSWVSDFAAISETCDLPNPCGAYGLCHVNGQVCDGCLDNRTGGGCLSAGMGDLCGSGNGFRVLRRVGVDLVNDELIGFEKVGSLDECEKGCESNCQCWGAVYKNLSGYCYRIEYPIQTVVVVDVVNQFGYFKVRNEANGDDDGRKKVGLVLLIIIVLLLVGGCGYGGYRVLNGKLWRRSEDDEDVVMPYKDLNSSSFRSIEMSNSFRK